MSSAASPGGAAPDEAARRQALDIANSYIVQAPAGSGKTELLIQRFLALLGAVREPESVLAITFTRKAAGEMRQRVVEALEDAAQAKPARDATNALTLQLALSAASQDALYGWRLREFPARLRILTVDALCAAVAARMPWLSRLGGDLKVVEDAAPLYAEAAARTFAMLEDGSALAADVARIGLHLDNNTRRLRTGLTALLERRDQWMRFLGAGLGRDALRAGLTRTLELTIEAELASLRAAIPAGLARDMAASFLVAASHFRWPDTSGLPGGSAGDLPAWRNFADLLLTKDGEWRRKVTKAEGFPPEARKEKQAITDLLGRLAGQAALREKLAVVAHLPLATLAESQWEALEALCRLLPAAAAQLKQVFLARRQVDFIEIAQAALRALGSADSPTDLALYFGERLEHILIDEAQDTSNSQMELVERLLAGWDPAGARTLFVVGDPMQSIYRFREADVALFLRLRAAGAGQLRPRPLRLAANFRSRPPITEWVNQSFSAIFPPAEDAAAGAVAYARSEPVRENARAATVSVHPFFSPDMDAEADAVVRLVEQHRASRTAILVRARTHAVAIAEQLGRRGVRFRAVDLDPLDKRPVVGDLVALTRALLHLADRTAWLAVLRAPWCGLTLGELLGVTRAAGNGVILDALETFDSPRIAPVRDTLRRAVGRVRRAPLREAVEQAWVELGGPSCLRDEAAAEDARRFLALLEQHEEAGELAGVTSLETHAAKLFAEPDPEADDSLQIMTIHKAKGLEFDTVIVPGLGRAARGGQRRLLRWDDLETKEGLRLRLAAIEAADDESDPLYDYLGRLEAGRMRHETVRLLYVAATRAREQLHLLGHVKCNEDGPREPASGSLLALLWPVVRRHFEEEYERRQETAQTSFEFVEPGEPAKLRQTMWRLREPPVVAPARPTPSEPGGPETEEEAGLERVVGIITHGFLDRLARRGPGWWQALSGAERSTVVEGVARAYGLSEADLAAATAQVSRILDRVCLSERARWILAPRETAATELALTTAAGRHVVDRTFVEDGVRWVIDYKTGLGAGYREQLTRYGEVLAALEQRPVRLAVYFPVTGEWEEWALPGAAASG